MKTALLVLVYTTFFLTACSQQDTVVRLLAEITDKRFAVGRSSVLIRTTKFETETPFFLLQLHGDEITAADAAREMAHRWGIHFIQLHNPGARLVTFTLGKKTFRFDPNRIFSDDGIRKTLRLSGGYNDAAFRQVKRFSDSLLSMLEQGKPIVAVHNNTEGRFTILQYRDAETGQVHINADQDEDDFFITNDPAIFSLLKAENFNVVLEDVSQLEDDGSLSLYCTQKNIRYINVEAQHGHRQEQELMLALVKRILN